ncbi:MAG: hypothetical protein ACFFD2_28435, partial [Promethearchaeota archaeon]
LKLLNLMVRKKSGNFLSIFIGKNKILGKKAKMKIFDAEFFYILIIFNVIIIQLTKNYNELRSIEN